jgi:hypothetical protein
VLAPGLQISTFGTRSSGSLLEVVPSCFHGLCIHDGIPAASEVQQLAKEKKIMNKRLTRPSLTLPLLSFICSAGWFPFLPRCQVLYSSNCRPPALPRNSPSSDEGGYIFPSSPALRQLRTTYHQVSDHCLSWRPAIDSFIYIGTALTSGFRPSTIFYR